MNIQLFVPCLVEDFRPEIAEATARVLTRAGVRVRYPSGQTCCGQPLYKTGRFDESRDLARRFIDLFSGPDPVVAPSGSCVAMVRKGYQILFEDDRPMLKRARELASRTFELSEFLVRELGVKDTGAKLDGIAAYHDSCQVGRALGLKNEPRELLASVSGLTVKELSRPDACCGFGGAFSVAYPNLSSAITADKIDDIIATGADMAVTAEVSCLMNIDSALEKRGSAIRALHLAEMLDAGVKQ
jgi:L-lactate dehydrogenase complex protein LldE